jgi:hypothetical protein
VGAAARFIDPEPERRAAVDGLQHLDVLTERWTGARSRLSGLNRGVTMTRKDLRRFIQTLDRSDRAAIGSRVDEFTGAVDALLNFEYTARIDNLTPAQSRQLAEARKKLWLEVRRSLGALINQIIDIDA